MLGPLNLIIACIMVVNSITIFSLPGMIYLIECLNHLKGTKATQSTAFQNEGIDLNLGFRTKKIQTKLNVWKEN